MANEPASANFDDAFANLLKEENAANAGETGVKKPDVPNTPKSAAETAATATAAETAAAEAEAAKLTATTEGATTAEAPAEGEETEIEPLGAEGAEGEPPPPAEHKSATDDALARLADMLSQRQPQPAPQPTREQPAPTPPPAFNADEQAFLTQYMTDFPDVARAEGLMRRAEYQQLTQHIFREVAGYFAPKLALLEQLADGAAYSAITQRVPKYDEMRDQVAEWVKTQPAYLQVGMNHVIQQGTAEEIADLFDRFSQATGAAAPAATGDRTTGGQQVRQPPAPAPKPAAELSPAVKQAAARLAPVTGKRSAPTQAAPMDFNSAFDEFAKAG